MLEGKEVNADDMGLGFGDGKKGGVGNQRGLGPRGWGWGWVGWSRDLGRGRWD